MWTLWLSLALAAPPVDLNSASAEAIEVLPGIAADKAAAIIRWREQHGPLARLEDLDAIPGIGAATIDALRGLAVTLPPPAAATKVASSATEAVNINTATEAEIAALPGIGPRRAAAIVADREASGPFRRCSDLSRVVGLGPSTVAALGDRCSTGR
jgi:competence protein ComEA